MERTKDLKLGIDCHEDISNDTLPNYDGRESVLQRGLWLPSGSVVDSGRRRIIRREIGMI